MYIIPDLMYIIPFLIPFLILCIPFQIRVHYFWFLVNYSWSHVFHAWSCLSSKCSKLSIGVSWPGQCCRGGSSGPGGAKSWIYEFQTFFGFPHWGGIPEILWNIHEYNISNQCHIFTELIVRMFYFFEQNSSHYYYETLNIFQFFIFIIINY